MPEFEWLVTPRSRQRPQVTMNTRDDEVQRRATIFARLGYPQSVAEARLRSRLLWECERLGQPVLLKRLPQLVSEAYQRAGVSPPQRSKKRR